MTNTTRPTLASTNARIDTIEASLARTIELVARAVALVEAGQHATPAVVAQITSAPSAKARTRKSAKATGAVLSFDEGQALADTGVDPATITVLAGKFGQGGTQTLAEARAKRAAGEAKRAAYLAERGTKASAPKAAKPAKATKATKAQAAQASVFGLGSIELKALADKGDKAAQAEIARRAAKRAAKLGA